MPAPADLTITNQSNASVTIQTHAIAAGATYTVSFSDIVTFAKDPFLNIYVLTGQVYLTALGSKLTPQQGSYWLNQVAAGNIVYAS